MSVPKLGLELAPGKKLGSFALAAMRDCLRIASISVVVRERDVRGWGVNSEDNGRMIRIVPCPEAVSGMSFSLRAGLIDALASPFTQPEAILVALADQPFITAELLNRLIDVYRADRRLDYVACANGELAVPPVLFAPTMYRALSELEGDAGARKLLASPLYRGVTIEAPAERMLLDVDTPLEFMEARRCWNGLNREGGNQDGGNGVGGDETNRQAIR